MPRGINIHKYIVLYALLSICTITELLAWGFWGHRRINEFAIFTLPSELMVFYKQNAAYIKEHAVDADKRRYRVKEEAPRHYIDLDEYEKEGLDKLPKTWNKAVEKYTEDSLTDHGVVPWHVQLVMKQLTEAFKAKDIGKVLYYSANLGHYVADAHVPLHTTSNYNGQKTGQNGIHGLWESRIPELVGDNFDFFIGKAEYIKNPTEKIWKIVLESHAAVDSVLTMEKQLNDSLESDVKYSFSEKNHKVKRSYSAKFVRAYNQKLNGMVERRMRQSIIDLGSFWYTAWVNAGKPDLSSKEMAVKYAAESGDTTESQGKRPTTHKIKGHDD